MKQVGWRGGDKSGHKSGHSGQWREETSQVMDRVKGGRRQVGS